MSKIGTEEVERLARLARIGLTKEETSQISVELGRIVDYVEQLGAIDTSGIDETSQVTGLHDVTRQDTVLPVGISKEELLKNAPMQQDGYIKVRRVKNG